jgi:hypothetical protein
MRRLYPAIAIEANPANRAKWRFHRRKAAPTKTKR